MKTDWLPAGARAALVLKDNDAGQRPLIHCPIPGASKTKFLDLSAVSKEARTDRLVRFLVECGMVEKSEAIDVAVDAVSESPDAGDLMQGWTLSTKRVDSYKDTIDPDGWDLTDYHRNPVVLFAHDSTNLPVGRDIGTWIDPGKSLKGITRFTAKDLNDFGHTVGKLVQAGFLNATSVGFEPVEYAESQEREGSFFFPAIDFTKQQLREYSVVPVPANPDALADGRSRGIDMSPIVKWAEKILDGNGALYVPRSVVENVRRSAAGNPVKVRVAEGVELTPVEKITPVEEEQQIADGNFDAEEDEKEEEKAAGNGMCPSCGYEAPMDDFLSPDSPAQAIGDESQEQPEGEQEKAAGGGLPTASAPRQDDLALQGLAERVARTVVQEVQRQMMERTGRLP